MAGSLGCEWQSTWPRLLPGLTPFTWQIVIANSKETFMKVAIARLRIAQARMLF
jgi:hypothetical protein